MDTLFKVASIVIPVMFGLIMWFLKTAADDRKTVLAKLDLFGSESIKHGEWIRNHEEECDRRKGDMESRLRMLETGGRWDGSERRRR